MKKATLACVFFLVFNNMFCQDLDEVFYYNANQYFQLGDDYGIYAEKIALGTIVPDNKKIHVVILSDGYDQDPYTDQNGNVVNPRQNFADDFLDLVNTLKVTTPFKEYESYFTFYAFKTISTRGVEHPRSTPVFCPGTCTQCNTAVPNDETLMPANTNTPSFGSSLDNFGIHRGLASDVDLVNSFVADYFGANNPNVVVIVLDNLTERAGTANIPNRIANISGRYTQDLNGGDEQGGVHEFAHAFAGLQDEYYFACPDCFGFDCSTFNIAPNRFEGPLTVPLVAPPITSLPWKHWFLDENDNLISPPITTTPPIGNIPFTGAYPAPINIRKPCDTSCKMFNELNNSFCAVCREALIERIHGLVSPINSYTPSNNNAQVFPISSSQSFEVNLTIPVRTAFVNDFASMVVNWSILDESGTNTIESIQQVVPTITPVVPSAAIYKFIDPTHASICDWFAGKEAGNYQIKVEVYDRAGLSEDLADNTRWVRDPLHDDHKYYIVWNVYYNGIPGTDLYAEDISGDGGIELSSGSFNLWSSPDIWLCNDENSDCAQTGEAPSYDGPNAEAQINLLVKNRGCKMFDASQDNGTVTFWWAKAKTNLEWPNDWDGDEIVPSGPLEGDQIVDPVNLTEDIDISNTEGVVVSAIWAIPNPDDYAAFDLYNAEITHFCFLGLITSDNDQAAMINDSDPYPLYRNVLQSNNIVWRNIAIIDDFTGGATGQTTSTDVIRGGAVIVSNNESVPRDYKIKFEVPTTETGKPITEEAEVRIILSDSLWSKWIEGGQQAYNVAVYDSSLHQVLLEDTLCTLSGIHLDSNTHFGMYVSVNFLTQERTSKELFNLSVTQILDDTSQRVLGGEMYAFMPDPNRSHFTANAGADKEVVIGNIYDNKANTLSESAIYNWYNAAGIRVHTGATKTDTATTTGTTTYKLEVIASSDGYKDYDELIITKKLGIITGVVPNPISTGTLAIDYKVATSVGVPKIRIVNVNTSAYTEHSITTGTGTLNVDISAYASGAHSILLICDSTTADDELLIVQ